MGSTLNTTHGGPVFHGDFWSDATLLDPYPVYRELRAAGPAVWLEQHGAWALTRHDVVRAALRDGELFSSAQGVALNDPSNAGAAGTMLSSDDPLHRKLRIVFTRPLMPAALKKLQDRLTALVERRVEELLQRARFDAVCELAHFLPLTVVTELVGLSEEGKSQMLRWAAGMFDSMGPITHERTVRGLEITMEAIGYIMNLSREELDPDGWGAALFAATDDGRITPMQAQTMLLDYLAPALDTTINASSSAIWLFAQHPDQWSKLRRNPALVSAAIDEVLRLESPIRAFSRLVTRDYRIGEARLRAGERALMLYACANRDERRYTDPDRFDIERDARDHLGFGHGTHICAGMHLARMEVTLLLQALARQVERFTLLEAERNAHNTLRGLARLIVAVE